MEKELKNLRFIQVVHGLTLKRAFEDGLIEEGAYLILQYGNQITIRELDKIINNKTHTK